MTDLSLDPIRTFRGRCATFSSGGIVPPSPGFNLHNFALETEMLRSMRIAFALTGVAAAGAFLPAAIQVADAAPKPQSCKYISQTLNPGQKWQGHSCKWKYGCDCNVQACQNPYNKRWVPKPGTGNCINLPG